MNTMHLSDLATENSGQSSKLNLTVSTPCCTCHVLCERALRCPNQD